MTASCVSAALFLRMLIRDVRVHGELLAGQRRVDLAGTDPAFWTCLRTHS